MSIIDFTNDISDVHYDINIYRPHTSMAALWYHYFLLQVYQLLKVRHTVISPLVWLLCSYTVYRKLVSTCSALYYHLANLDEFHIQLLLLYMDAPFFYSYAVFGGGFQFFLPSILNVMHFLYVYHANVLNSIV